MKIQHIENAAHGSSGVSELNTRRAWVLTSANIKKSTFARRHKIILFFALCFLCCLCARASVYLYTYDSNNTAVSREIPITNKGYGYDSPDYSNEVFSVYYNNYNGFYHTRRGFLGPLQTVDTPTNGPSPSISYQIQVATFAYANPLFFPRIATLYNTVESLYLSGYRSAGLQVVSESSYTHYVNFNFSLIVSDILSSTNNAYQSIVLSTLNNIYSHVQGINTGIQGITVDLGQFQRDYQTVNSGVLNISNYIDAASANGVISASQADIYKADIASANSNPDVWGDPEFFARSVYDNIEAIKNTFDFANALNERPNILNDFAGQFGDAFSSAGSYHYTTPLTNEMQRMSTNWVQELKASASNWVEETKAALSNNTQKIKDDLQAWKDQLSGPNGSQASIVSKLDGAINNQGAVKVEVQNSNNELHVNVNGPIELKATQFNDINNKLQANFDQFHDWVYDIPESWVRYYNLFRDNSSAVLTNQLGQASLLSSLTNLVSDFSGDFFDFSLSFASNTTFAVSNALLGLSLSPTNELWDYYFDRFKKANEFKDDSGLPFSVDLFRQQVFGSGFDESKFRQLDWFSRVELLLYQISFAETNDAPEAADIETDLEDVAETVSAHAEDFVATSVKVVSVFNLLKRFADSVKLAFTPQNGQLDPMTSGIVLLQGGSWLVNEPLVLNVPVPIQNALRLVFQCIWYLGAFVVGWRVFSAAWDRVVSVVRWIWSVFDI